MDMEYVHLHVREHLHFMSTCTFTWTCACLHDWLLYLERIVQPVSYMDRCWVSCYSVNTNSRRLLQNHTKFWQFVLEDPLALLVQEREAYYQYSMTGFPLQIICSQRAHMTGKHPFFRINYRWMVFEILSFRGGLNLKSIIHRDILKGITFHDTTWGPPYISLVSPFNSKTNHHPVIKRMGSLRTSKARYKIREIFLKLVSTVWQHCMSSPKAELIWWEGLYKDLYQ